MAPRHGYLVHMPQTDIKRPRPHYRPRTATEFLGGFTGAIGFLLIFYGLVLAPAITPVPVARTTSGNMGVSLLVSALFCLLSHLAFTGLRRAESRTGGFQAAFLSDTVGTISFLGVLLLSILVHDALLMAIDGGGTPPPSIDLVTIVLTTLSVLIARTIVLRRLFPGFMGPVDPTPKAEE
jgi:hypothetical protein